MASLLSADCDDVFPLEIVGSERGFARHLILEDLII
jgi:hypothetical protein